jgi:hypothetical protein
VRVLAEYYIKLKYEKNKTIPLSIECLRYKKNYVEDQDTDLDKFVKDCIIFTITKIDTEKEKEQESEAVFVPVKDVWHRYLKYFGYVDAEGNPDEKNKEALTQNKFTRYLKRDYMAWGLNYKQKKIKGYPVLCFFNIELAPDDGKEHETTPPELQPADPPQREEPDYMNPPEENPFGD